MEEDEEYKKIIEDFKQQSEDFLKEKRDETAEFIKKAAMQKVA